jgi:WXXGXW repeat (2 copies)
MKRSISSKFGRRVGALLLAIAALTASAAADAGLYLSVTIAPPVLPVYEQPLIPGPGYIWTPGYWAWGPDGYYWVPGTWVVAPFVGALWTPGYWGWGGGVYLWHAGYWGPHVGFYGGINYGFGYTGAGYQGGYWQHGSFCYNRAVNHVNVTNITNTYNTTVINRTTTRVSYNGGSGGVVAQPTPQERIAERDRHTPVLPVQAHHELAASSDRALLASVNHGHPAVAATARPARVAAGSAPARSFSQLAAVRPAPVPPRNSGVGPTSHAPQAPAQRPAPPQAPVRPQGPQQAQMHPQAPVHPSAQPQGAPPQRAPRGGPDERQHS